MKNKRFVFCIAALLFLASLTGCLFSGKEPISETEAAETDIPETDAPEIGMAAAFKNYLDEAGDRVYGFLQLTNGDVLVIEEEEDYYWEEVINDEKKISTLEYAFVLLSLDQKSGMLNSHWLGSGDHDIPYLSIFYQDNFDQYSTCCSCCEILPAKDPTDVLIMVCPDPWPTGLFEESEYHGLVPADNLDTVPVCVQNAEWRGGFPVWVFDVPYAAVTEDYRLEYAAYVLTGKDILSFTWSPETGRITSQGTS